MTYYTIMGSPIGDVMLVSAADAVGTAEPFALTGVFLLGQRFEPPIGAGWIRDADVFADAEKQLDAYFAGQLTSFDLPLLPRGSDFQRSVWTALLDVPYGSTCSYGEIAERVADRSKTRAVAAAIGRNPLGVVVPCHRVIGADGSLTGYAGGLERKRWLLDHEAQTAGLML